MNESILINMARGMASTINALATYLTFPSVDYGLYDMKIIIEKKIYLNWNYTECYVYTISSVACLSIFYLILCIKIITLMRELLQRGANMEIKKLAKACLN